MVDRNNIWLFQPGNTQQSKEYNESEFQKFLDFISTTRLRATGLLVWF